MSEVVLFESSRGPVHTSDFREALLRTRANEADIIYVHSGLQFGRPSRSITRSQLLDEVLETILNIGVPTVCMPTYTFSFCNGENFDTLKSRSHMGSLNEHFRKQPNVVRSDDPLMSVAAFGSNLDLVQDLGIQSIGKDSTFDKLSQCSNVKFVFLGVHPGDCFTYMHFLEWKAGVPYRYDREFSGIVTSGGVSSPVTKKLFVRYNGVHANSASYLYGDLLNEVGYLHRVEIGESAISSVDLRPAEETYLDLLAKDPNYFIAEPFDSSRVSDEFNVINMVAL